MTRARQQANRLPNNWGRRERVTSCDTCDDVCGSGIGGGFDCSGCCDDGLVLVGVVLLVLLLLLLLLLVVVVVVVMWLW